MISDPDFKKSFKSRNNLVLASVANYGSLCNIMIHYLDEIESKRPMLLDYRPANDKALLTALILNNPELSAKQILNMFGLKKALESVSMRELRAMFAKLNQRGWQRLMNDVKKLQLPTNGNVIGVLRKHLVRLKRSPYLRKLK